MMNFFETFFENKKIIFVVLFATFAEVIFPLPSIKRLPDNVLEISENQNAVVFIYRGEDLYQRKMLLAFRNARRDFGIFSYNVDGINEENLMELTEILTDDNVKSVCVATADVPDIMLRILVKLDKMIVFTDEKLPNRVGKFAVEKADENKFAQMLVDELAQIISNEGDVAIFVPKEKDEYSELFLQAIFDFCKISKKEHSEIAMIEIPRFSDEEIKNAVKFTIMTYPNLKAIVSLSPNLTEKVCLAMESQNENLQIPVTGICTPSVAENFVQSETVPFFAC
jgi:DNA-binding LacI/PurR family transcriptional regulator